MQYYVNREQLEVVCLQYIHCAWNIVHKSVYRVQCAVICVEGTVCSIRSTDISVHCSAYREQCTLICVHGRVYSIMGTMNGVQVTVCSILCTV